MEPYILKDCTFKNNRGDGIDSGPPAPRRLEIGDNLYWLIVTCALLAWCIFGK